jgi:cyanophycin synthetase
VNIYPRDIESVLEKHPAVSEAAAFPFSHSEGEQIPFAAVSINTPVSEEELKRFCNSHMGWRAPQRIFHIDSFPRNGAGKVLKKELAKTVSKKPQTPKKDIFLKTINNARIFNIKLHRKQLFNLELIDEWLSSILKIQIELYTCPIVDPRDKSKIHLVDTLWRILLLSKTLLQSVRIPVFEAGEIVAILEDVDPSQPFTVTVSIPDIEFIPPKTYETVLLMASKIVLDYGNKPITSENIQILFNDIEAKIINPLIPSSGSGKSTIPVLSAAYRLAIPFRHLGHGIYQLGWGSKSRRMDRSMVDSDSAIGAKMAQNKIHTAHLLRMAGLPAPEHKVLKTKEEALSAAQQLGWPVVVKPADQDRGEGVSVGVTNEELLFDAFETAHTASRSKQVIIEREVQGVCCRVFIANQQLLYAVKRLPKSVVGDGKKSIIDLLKKANLNEKNTPPWLKSEPFPIDLLAIEAMKAEGFTLESIPECGRLVPLRKIESTQWGGVDEEVTQSIHPENLAAALRAAELFGLQVAGIDIITPDISVPWYENGAIINEVNFSPLLGGGEISKRQIPIFLQSFLHGDGRIPIIVIIGDTSAMEYARTIQTEAIDKGVRCYTTSHKQSTSHTGEGIHFQTHSLYQRCKTLLMYTDVDMLILVVHTDEFLDIGLPVDRIDRVEIISRKLSTWALPEEILSHARLDDLVALIERYRE